MEAQADQHSPAPRKQHEAPRGRSSDERAPRTPRELAAADNAVRDRDRERQQHEAALDAVNSTVTALRELASPAPRPPSTASGPSSTKASAPLLRRPHRQPPGKPGPEGRPAAAATSR